MDRDIKQLNMEARLELLSASIESLEVTVRDLDLNVREIDEAIRGNGQPGIQTRLALHDQRLAQTDSMMAEIHGLRRWLFLGVLSLLGSVVWQAVQYLMQTPSL